MSVQLQKILSQAITDGIANSELTAIGVMDFDAIEATVEKLKRAFPDNFEHTFAVKANALLSVLESLRLCGIGAEVASSGELELALEAGFPTDKIIFDSPAKTRRDLRHCIINGISINIDNLQELARVDKLVNEFPNTSSVIGFRINPQIGSGDISSTSTATNTSKFGFPLRDEGNYEVLFEVYKERPWLSSLHTHTGSQGCPLPLMATGIRVITELAEQINAYIGSQQITRLDIGGGLPVNFSSEEVKPSFTDYAEILQNQVPLLFTGKYQVKTEFGRAITAKNGFIVTRVEYTKQSGGRHIAATHAGAQIITRTAFLPQSWPIRVSAYDPQGQRKTQNLVDTDVAGPCCFAADLITKNTKLPMLEPDDYVIVHDTGAYYFSNHFDYNSFPRIAVYGSKTRENNTILECIRSADDLATVVSNMRV